jgi:hypothetical protein
MQRIQFGDIDLLLLLNRLFFFFKESIFTVLGDNIVNLKKKFFFWPFFPNEKGESNFPHNLCLDTV